MATEIIHTIKSSGGDYTSLSAWEAAQQRDLVAADEIAIAECYGFRSVDAVNINGWTADETRYIVVRAATGSESKIPWSDAAFTIASTDYFATIQISEQYVRVERIQIENFRTMNNLGDEGAGIYISSAPSGSITIAGCNVRKVNPAGTSDTCAGIDCGDGYDGNMYVVNNLFTNFKHGVNLRVPTSASYVIYNNTAANCVVYGLFTFGDAQPNQEYRVMRNNLCVGNGLDFSAFSSTISRSIYENNVSSDATAPTSSVSGLVFHNRAVTFVNSASGDYRLANTDTGARYAGANLSADIDYPFSTDLFGTTRIAPWDVGAHDTGIVQLSSSIKSSGGDYTSLSAWEAAQQRDLVTSKSIAIAECYPFEDTTSVIINGWVADTSHPIIVRTPSQHRPRTTWDTDAYRLYINIAANALEVLESDVIIDGLQIRGAYGTQFSRIGLIIGGEVSGSVIVRNNNIVGDIVTWDCYGIYYNKSNSPGNQTVLVHNNVVSGWMNPDGTGGDAVGIYMNQYGFQHVFNNTIVSCSIGLRATSIASVISASNNLVYLCNTASFGTFDFASNNATDSSSIVGTNSRASQTFTFESGSYRLSTFDGGARTFGTNLSTIPTGSFTTDFDGNLRRRNWDIGAFQNNEQRIDIGSGGGNRITGSAVTLFMDDFNRANGPIGQNYESSAYTTGSYGTQSLTILNNQVRAPQTSRNCFSAVSPSAQTFSVDHEATVTYGALSTSDRAGPLVRGNPLSGSGYALTLDGTSAGNRRINKLLTGSYVLIDGLSLGNISIPVKVGDQVTLRAVGNTISAYKNNQLVDSVTDNDYSTGGPGLFYDSGNSNITYIDNFIATDIPPQGKIGQLMTITPT